MKWYPTEKRCVGVVRRQLARAALGAIVSALAACGSDNTPVLQLITVAPSAPSLAQGATQQLTATGKYSDSSTKDLTSAVTWASLDPAVATVSAGLVQANSVGGKAVITATLGEQVGFSQVTVPGTPVLELIAVTPTSPSLAQGATQQLTATGKYTDGSTQDLTPTVTWASLDPTVATVSGGLVHANSVSGGSAAITATVGEQVGFTEVTVTGAVLGKIVLYPSTATVPEGAAVHLVAMGIYSDGSLRDLTSAAAWATAAGGTATAAGGAVTGVAAGDTTVSATLGDLTASAPVTVTTATLDSIVVTPSNAPTVAPGDVEAFSAFGVYSDSTVYDLTDAVTWASSNEAAATISTAAGTRGQATAVAAGSTDVTATLGGVTSAAQPLTVADAATDYTEARVPFTWANTPDAAYLVAGDDEEAALPAIDGFSFSFFGTSFTSDQIHVSTNGAVFFGAGDTGTSYGTTIPTASTPNGFFAAFWEDLITTVSFQVVGTAPTRQIVIDWAGTVYSTVDQVRFQAVLTEGTNQLDAYYLTLPPPGDSYTIGVENPTGTVGTQHTHSADATVPGLGLRFSP
jgi:uncharacterized protein YjdB